MSSATSSTGRSVSPKAPSGRTIWVRANAYLQDAAPWVSLKADPATAAVATRTALDLVRLSAVLAWSIVPDLAAKVLGLFGGVPEVPPWPQTACEAILSTAHAGQRLGTIGPLVAKITDEHVARLEARFGGAAVHDDLTP